jgi:hypothetical protein
MVDIIWPEIQPRDRTHQPLPTPELGFASAAPQHPAAAGADDHNEEHNIRRPPA